MIIGLTGPLASGKGTITDYLVKHHGAQAVKFSQPLRDMINRLYVKETRESMSKLAELMRAEYGNDILVRTLIKDLEKMNVSIAVFDGIRYDDEFNALKERDDFIMWAVDTDLELRFERIKKRGENAGDKELTMNQFKEQHTLPTEQMIPNLMEKADATINNNGTVGELHVRVTELLK
ncbi:AAA family ATPase [Patescibacteria group bacterium]|nr:AAA family ATPase [Patescibacteria group bacterium]